MIVLKDFILREDKKKYTAGDNFPRETISSDRVAELIAKGYLKGEDETVVEIKQEDDGETEITPEKPAKRSTEKKTSTRKRTKKG